MVFDIFGVAPWVVVSAVATWVGQSVLYRREGRRIDLDRAAVVDDSRNDLAVELLTNARNEVVAARAEMQGLRDEVANLRAMEVHFYHFQQAIDHLSAILGAHNEDERSAAERNAKAFLARMKRIQEAKDES